MNKRTKIYVIVLIWAAVIAQFFVNGSINREKHMVEEALSNGAYSVSNGSARAYGFYSNERLDANTKEAMAKAIAKKLGVKSGYSFSHKYDGLNETTTLTKEGEYGDTIIKIISLVSVDPAGNYQYENYILTELTLYGGSAKETYTYKKYLLNLYERLGISPVTNIYICNEHKGKLTDEEIDEEIDDFLDTMDANPVETIKLDGVICVYGYSHNIDSYVYQNGNKVNVNIAISYDEDTDVTLIHQAVPFVDKSF